MSAASLFKPVLYSFYIQPNYFLFYDFYYNCVYFYNRQIKKFPTEKQNVSLKHILT